MITQFKEIVKIFADHYTKIFRGSHMKGDPKKHRKGKKNMATKLFTERELKAAIKKTEH